jgi:hypothetical protein
MSMTIQQKRKRDMTITVIVVLVALSCLAVKRAYEGINGQLLPGYLPAAPQGNYAALDWGLLQQGTWDIGHGPQSPAALLHLNGTPARLSGHLLPLHTPGVSSQFFIAAKPRGCYFCNPPGVAEVVQVNIAGNKQIADTDYPVTVYGTFRVATKVNDPLGNLYVLDDAQVKMGRG